MKDLFIRDFRYELPPELIAIEPLSQRENSRLLVVHPGSKGSIQHSKFSEILSFLPKRSTWIMNETRVLPARLKLKKESGGAVEVFLLRPLERDAQGFWDAWIRGNIKPGQKARNDFFIATVESQASKEAKVSLSWENGKDFLQILNEGGETPLPPYLMRAEKESDRTRYQTVFAKTPGSVAAPTASLHFSDEVFQKLKATHEVLPLTLHVGAGTFNPVTVEKIIGHEMHPEIVEIPRHTLEALETAFKNDVYCAGTTSLRALESAVLLGERILREGAEANWLRPIEMNEAYEDWKRFPVQESIAALLSTHTSDPLRFETKLFLGPGARYSPVKGLLTNFHLPESTLLCLVAGFLGEDHWKRVYKEAIAHKYRFYSYGDASLLLK